MTVGAKRRVLMVLEGHLLRFLWRRFIAERVTQSMAARLAPELEARIASAVTTSCSQLQSDALAAIDAGLIFEKPWKANLHIPSIELQASADHPFLAHSTCCVRDFLHPEFQRFCRAMGNPLAFHRKVWEWVFILHHAVRTGAIGPGKRALGFGVGSEPLPATFAAMGAIVTATDAPADICIAKGWRDGGSYTSKVHELFRPGVVDRDTFDRNVTFAECDMAQIPPQFTGYDFCWSSCSFEHLGTLAAGLEFVEASIERTLKPGGIACHTTEFNLSSDDETVEAGPTVLYRKRDILKLIDVLQQRGHSVEPFSIAPDTHVLDSYVDTPPYDASPQLKLSLLGYVSTSVGLVIRRSN